MKRVAIIDLGSNTAKLIVMGYTPRRCYHLLDELRQVVRLSEGMKETGTIQPAAYTRGLEALESFHQYCLASGIDDVCATATSAVRDAKNGEAFLQEVQERSGLTLRILSGEEEAYYGTLAVANSMAFEDTFVLDIGGGSAQLSQLEQRRFKSGKSWPIGAVRMTERFFGSQPPKKKEVKALMKHVKGLLDEGVPSFAEATTLVGMGGTIRNLARIQEKRENYPVDLTHSYFFPKEALETITEDLLSKSVSERQSIDGLSSDRADIIAGGAVVAREVLRRSQAPGIVISRQGLREGLFYPYLLEGEDPPLLDNVRDFHVRNLERLYYDNRAHNAHVQGLALELFDALEPLHGYGSFERELLAHAATLHDIGMAVSYYDHHKHGFYLVMAAALPGFNHREQAIMALLVRYHRKGSPDTQGLDAVLEEGDPERILKLSALLRLAEYLERSKAQLVEGLTCRLEGKHLEITVHAAEPVHIEVQEATMRKDLLERSYGLEVDIVLADA